MTQTNQPLLAHADQVWRTLMRILSNEEEASDCYQQVFVDAMRLETPDVKSWQAVMCQIATRRAMDHLRKKYRDRNRTESLPDSVYSEEQPELSLMYEELRDSVRETLATLPTNQAEAFWLRKIEKLSASEVAKQLGVSVGNVRVLVHRAATQLRQSLGPVYDNYLQSGASNDNS